MTDNLARFISKAFPKDWEPQIKLRILSDQVDSLSIEFFVDL